MMQLLMMLIAGVLSASAASVMAEPTGVIAGLGNATNFFGLLMTQLAGLGGAAFLLTAVYQYTQYRKNPIGGKLSTVVVLFLCGCALLSIVIVPYMSNEG